MTDQQILEKVRQAEELADRIITHLKESNLPNPRAFVANLLLEYSAVCR